MQLNDDLRCLEGLDHISKCFVDVVPIQSPNWQLYIIEILYHTSYPAKLLDIVESLFFYSNSLTNSAQRHRKSNIEHAVAKNQWPQVVPKGTVIACLQSYVNALKYKPLDVPVVVAKTVNALANIHLSQMMLNS